MNELLANPAVQAALAAAIVVGLNALVVWLKQKFPTQAASVEANWCYLQPVVQYAMDKAHEAVEKHTLGDSVINKIVAKAVVDFANSYNLFEGKAATSKEIEAARAEIAASVLRVTGG